MPTTAVATGASPDDLAALQARVPGAYSLTLRGADRSDRRARRKVVFCHGYGGSPSDSVLPDLVRRLRQQPRGLEITAPHMEPTRGRRRLAPSSLRFAVAQIASAVEHEEGKVSLIGDSFGGLAALMYAARHPEKIDKLVLLAPGVGVVGRLKEELGISARGRDATTQALARALARAKRELARTGGDGRVRRVRELRETVNLAALALDIHGYGEARWMKRLTVPTLVFRADRDVLVRPGDVDRIAKVAPARVRIVGLPDADHMFEGALRRETRANFDRISSEIARFLKLK